MQRWIFSFGDVGAMIESGLWIILLEAAVALGLLVFIVWWTLPRKPRGKDREGP
jgi:hypothetical protein